jgi:hypothetical protein
MTILLSSLRRTKSYMVKWTVRDVYKARFYSGITLDIVNITPCMSSLLLDAIPSSQKFEGYIGPTPTFTSSGTVLQH